MLAYITISLTTNNSIEIEIMSKELGMKPLMRNIMLLYLSISINFSIVQTMLLLYNNKFIIVVKLYKLLVIYI